MELIRIQLLDLLLRCRLRRVVESVKKDEIDKDQLVQFLEETVSILEQVYDEETRRICGTDDELSESAASAVPEEVRDWLASTFTRSLSRMSNTFEKKRFKSVANVIRAGIFVDRMYRRLSSGGMTVPAPILYVLKNVENWTFDVFNLHEVSDGHCIKYVGFQLLQRYDLIRKFKISNQALECFFMKIEEGYRKHNNPYHNDIHASDVLQTTNYFISQSGLADWLTDLEVFAVLISALIHDFEHTGTTNAFHINTSSDFALLYNDKSVLENHHVSKTFRILQEEDTNILAGLSRDEFFEFRNLAIEMVLATDMTFHFTQVKQMKSLLAKPDNVDKHKVLSLILHTADIGHPGKSWELHQRWTNMLVQEFFKQGDRERELGLPVSPLCDRNTVLVSESQIGFIEVIVEPTYIILGEMLTKILEPLIKAVQNEKAAHMEQIKEDSDEKPAVNNTAGETSQIATTPWMSCLLKNKQMWKKTTASASSDGAGS